MASPRSLFLSLVFLATLAVFANGAVIKTSGGERVLMFQGRRWDKYGMVPPPTLDHVNPQMLASVESNWFEQKLDHFHPEDTRTWSQLYYRSSAFANSSEINRPVFLYIGGEGAASSSWLVGGHMVEIAKQHQAELYELEHRYYGKSRPTSDLSLENLKFLSSEQALADLANFITEKKLERPDLANSPWIVFGGSYAGNLAAWARLKYPHLIQGAVASSAPVLAKVDFSEYYAVVRDALKTTGPDCIPAIEKGVQQMEALLGKEGGPDELTNLFSLLTPLDVTKSDDVSNLFSSISGYFQSAVQYNQPGANGARSAVEQLCDVMTSEQGEPIERLARINRKNLGVDGKLDHRYATEIELVRKEDYESAGAMRQWVYQTCTEFGYYQASDLEDQPFGHLFPLEWALKLCSDIYTANFTPEFVHRSVNWSNVIYGDLKLEAEKIILPNGSLDPWHVLSILEDKGPDTVVAVIEGASHCTDLYAARSTDSPSLLEARSKVQKYVAKWIKDHEKKILNELLQ